MIVSAVVFDFDGTLTRPHAIDWEALRRELGCARQEPVLEFIQAIPDAARRGQAEGTLERYEMAAAAAATPNARAEETVCRLAELGVPMAILTRNSRRAVQRSLENFGGVSESDFVSVITRDDGLRPKPDPEGLVSAARALGVPVPEVLCVGDYVFDVEIARAAGCPCAFLTNGVAEGGATADADFAIAELGEVVEIVRMHRRLPAGKLPNDLLARLLHEFGLDLAGVRVCPGVGEDCALVDLAEPGLLALKADPITFATDEIGYYAVAVNANDIATAGATPRWFLATLLLPLGTCGADVRHIMGQLRAAADEYGIVLSGGHTEITDTVNRPVICGQMVGTARRDSFVDKRNMQPGDAILLTKGAGIEGTAIIAREMPERLRQADVPETVIARGIRFLHDPGISIVPEARAAIEAGGVSAMHDVTVGGVATALEELSTAGGHGIRVMPGRIAVLPETAEVCRAVGADPLGLIGSGALLIACRATATEGVLTAVRTAGVPVARIGEAVDGPPGIAACDDGSTDPIDWPHFEVDEIARLFAG